MTEARLISPQTSEFRRIRSALFAAGFTTFCLLYYIQSLLPVFTNEFGVGAAQSSLALSVTTGVMAFALLVSGALSDAVGRKQIMFASLFSSSALTVAMAFAPSWTTIIAIRMAMGISLCGVQSVAMAYLSEELESKAFARSLGLFIGGSALGGMFGRMLASLITDYLGWRTAVVIIGVAGLGAAAYFQISLPTSRNFTPRGRGLRHLVKETRGILANPALLKLFFVGFAIMSGFVTIFNYITYRLVAAPYNLTQSAVGMVFVIYIVGSFGAAFAGRMVAIAGHKHTLWIFQTIMVAGILITLSTSFPIILIGLAVLTFGMFSSHSVASGWVSQKAQSSRALAASLYLFAYYQGGSLVGALGGIGFQSGGRSWVVGLTGAIGLLGIFSALSVGQTQRR